MPIELPKPPEGFARATGVVEGRKQCKDCNRQYPTITGAEPCPYCHGNNTTPVKTNE